VDKTNGKSLNNKKNIPPIDNKGKGQLKKAPSIPASGGSTMIQPNSGMPNAQQLQVGVPGEGGMKQTAEKAGPIVIYPDQRFKKMTQEETSMLKNNIERLTID